MVHHTRKIHFRRGAFGGRTTQFPSRGALPALALLLAVVSGPAAAQTVGQGREVVVTATRVETSPERVASSMTVVTADDIERHQYKDLVEILDAVPGLQVVQTGGRGKQTSIFTRGTESNHTLFLINGIEVGDPSATGGVFQLENLTAENIERVEIIRGPQSVLYGSDAIGGVVNVITKKGAQGIVASGSIEGGSFHSLETSAGLDGTYQDIDVNLHGSRFVSDGHTIFAKRLGGAEADGQRNYTGSARLGFRPTDRIEVGLFGEAISARSEIDPLGDDPNAVSKVRQIFASADVRAEVVEDVWDAIFAFSYNETDRSSVNPPDPSSPIASFSRFKGNKPKVELQNNVTIIDEVSFVLGGNIEWERGKQSGTFAPFSGTIVNRALFGEANVSLWDRLYLTAGGRADRNSRFGTELTHRYTAAYIHDETDTKIKGTYGTGFKAPNLSDLLGSNPLFNFFGNPNLVPEKTKSWDVGIEQGLFDDRVRFGTTYFHNKIKNLIESNATFTSLINVGEAKTWGLESFIAARIIDEVTLRIDHTYLRAEDTVDGTELLRRPRHKLGVGLTVRPLPRARVTVGVVTVGHRKDIDAVTFGRKNMHQYTTVRVAGSYEIAPNVTIFGRIENALDNNYEDPDGFQQPGIAAFAGIAVKFGLVD